MTAPLSDHALAVLGSIAERPRPSVDINAGVSNKLLKEGLVEIAWLPSPFKTHKGRNICHLRAMAAGIARLKEPLP